VTNLTDDQILELAEELDGESISTSYQARYTNSFTDLFCTSPLVVAYGMGVDSTAMLVGYYQRGIRPDLILLADTGSEKPETYNYLATIQMWLKSIGFPPVTIVRTSPKNPKRGMYRSLGEECIRDGHLPSLSYGFKGCSLKWKVGPQNKFVNAWQPAQIAWSNGVPVTQAVGYDCSAKDSKRYAHSQGKQSEKYHNVYPYATGAGIASVALKDQSHRITSPGQIRVLLLPCQQTSGTALSFSAPVESDRDH
jgi:hypothetical protein